MEMLVISVVAITAFVAVLLPLLRRGGSRTADEREFDADAAAADQAIHDEASTAAAALAPSAAAYPQGDVADDARIEREVLRYREALRAGTLCVRCGQANPPGSAYCSDCGKRLPLADAKEFA